MGLIVAITQNGAGIEDVGYRLSFCRRFFRAAEREGPPFNLPRVRSTRSSDTGSMTIRESSSASRDSTPRDDFQRSAELSRYHELPFAAYCGDSMSQGLHRNPMVSHTAFNFPVDMRIYVTLWLRIMRNRSVTYSAEAAFHALADPTRRAVLDLLRQGVQPAGQIARAFPVSRPAISKHLRLLRRAHLVQEKREGRHRLYQLNPEPLKAVDSWLEQYRSFWQANLSNLKTFVEAEYAREMAGAKRKAVKRSGENE